MLLPSGDRVSLANLEGSGNPLLLADHLPSLRYNESGIGAVKTDLPIRSNGAKTKKPGNAPDPVQFVTYNSFIMNILRSNPFVFIGLRPVIMVQVDDNK
jgi:hypothetical protein